MRMVAYCRVSTNKDEQLESLANQQEFFEQFATRNNHTLIKLYSDEGISGKQMTNRKEFLRLMEDAKLGLFDIVAVKDVSRFARNTVDFLVSIRELKSLNIEVLFLSTNQTILGGSEFVLTMFSALAQEESSNLSARVKFGKRVNAKHGKVPNFIYGYDWKNRFELTINEQQAEIVKKIFHLYVDEGVGSRRVAKILTEQQIPTYKGCERWIPKTVRRILENPIYKGTLISKKTEGINFLTGERKKLDDVAEFTFKKPELAIISEEIFDQAQILIAQRREIYANDTPVNRVSTKYPFSTLIKCEHCGYSFTRRVRKLKNGQVIEWKCAGRNVNDANFCPNLTKIKEDILLESITSHLFDKIKDKNKFIKEYEKNRQIHTVKKENPVTVQENISKLTSQKNKYMNMYVNEIITISELKTYIGQINNEIEKCRITLENLSHSETIRPITAEELYEHILIVLKGDYSNVALKKVIETITVNSDGEIKVIWK